MGFGRVLTSIHGLQQRLEDFSVEDVARTEANAQALALKLSQLQGKLRDVHNLKTLVASANARIGEITEENLDHVEPSGLKKYPDLHALIQADALIRRHGLTRPKKTAAVSNNASAAVDTTDFSTSPANHSFDDFVAPPLFAQADDDKIFAADIESAKSDVSTLATNERNSPDEWVFSADPEKNLGDDTATTHLSNFEIGTPIDNSPEALSQAKTTAPTKTAKRAQDSAPSSSPATTGFDEQLLNELIESYGEFTISTGATPSAKPSGPKVPAIKNENQPAPAESAAPPEPTPVEVREEAKSVPIEIPAPKTIVQEQSVAAVEILPARISEPEVEESKALIVPETAKSKKEQREARAKEKKLAAASKRGEIDRQLKSIVKDYGEYDLYSPGSSINFKLAAVGAFVVLGLVLGGFYFFKAPTTLKSAVQSSAQTNPNAAATPPANKPENPSK